MKQLFQMWCLLRKNTVNLFMSTGCMTKLITFTAFKNLLLSSIYNLKFVACLFATYNVLVSCSHIFQFQPSSENFYKKLLTAVSLLRRSLISLPLIFFGIKQILIIFARYQVLKRNGSGRINHSFLFSHSYHIIILRLFKRIPFL